MKKVFEVKWEGRKELTATELKKALSDFASDKDKFDVKRIGKIIYTDDSKTEPELESKKEKPEDLLGMGLDFNKSEDNLNDLFSLETKNSNSDKPEDLLGMGLDFNKGKESKKENDSDKGDMLDNLRGVL